MSWSWRKKDAAIELAEVLHRELARVDFAPLAASQFELPATAVQDYERLIALYKEAAVWLALIERGPENANITPVLKAYETLVFSSAPERREWAATAVHDLGELVKLDADESVAVVWARRWFEGLGHNETNAATLFLFAMCWIDFFLAAIQRLRRAIMHENGRWTDVDGMRTMHNAAASHSIFIAAIQRLRRAIMDENGRWTDVDGMRTMHNAAASHSIFIAARGGVGWAIFGEKPSPPEIGAAALARGFRE